MKMRMISILGSTGSIGTQTLQILDEQQDIRVAALTAHSNRRLLLQQVLAYRPKVAALWSQEDALWLAEKLRAAAQSGDWTEAYQVQVEYGRSGLCKAATVLEADLVVTAVVGMIGIESTLAAIEAGKDIALANKETLVCAGHLIMPLAKKKQVNIYPVDSEHSAIFQALQGNEEKQISRLLLTASGGPFRGRCTEELKAVTVEQALAHPNWSMGRKISIDSATLVNKGLELIEAVHLFGVTPEQIQVVVQPESIIHSMVEYTDGSVIAQLGTPDMRIPISYALYRKERKELSGRRLDFWQLGCLHFAEPDERTFLGLPLAREAITIGGSMPTVFNAANERAVALFLAGEISFLQIFECIRRCMQAHRVLEHPSVDEILQTEQWVYRQIESRE